ncbi:MAG TPA: FAD-dependent oxidoreductase [Anaerolineales bacterium]
MSEERSYFVAVVGGGPAGLFAAAELASRGVRAVIFNRDVKPGGLAEYGIYPDDHNLKAGFRNQFRQTLARENVTYFGNVTIGAHGDLTLDDLRKLGFHALLVTAGAQGMKSLGLPGEKLKGVYHAKDIVYYYNKLPPFSQMKFEFGKRCAVIGAGNVMTDIARFLIREVKVEEVIAVVRRGPCEVNFTADAMRHVIAHLDLAGFEAELRRVLPAMQAVNERSDAGRQKVLEALPKADPKFSETRFSLLFLASPSQIIGRTGHVAKLELITNTLEIREGYVTARATPGRQVLAVDSVILAIGDTVDDSLGLPTRSVAFYRNPAPQFPVDGQSYELFDLEDNSPIEDTFVGGWARRPSEGLVEGARRDGTNASKAVWQYLQTLQPSMPILDQVTGRLKALGKPVVTAREIAKLEAIESAEAQKRGLKEFKFATNEEMFQAIGLAETA